MWPPRGSNLNCGGGGKERQENPVNGPRTTRWGEKYMAGIKRRGFHATPDELRRKYGDIALVAASAYGSAPPPALPSVTRRAPPSTGGTLATFRGDESSCEIPSDA